jgi:hypothetical protein
MTRPAHIHPGDLHGLARLAAAATGGLTDLVEAMHHTIAWPPFLPSSARPGRTSGITGLVYASVRGTARLVGSSLDAALTPLVPWLGDRETTPRRDTALAVLNGVLGDYLTDTGNPLHQPMVLCSHGRTIAADAEALATAFPNPSRRIAVMIHGLCMNERGWQRDGHNHGLALAGDLGYSPVYVRYNSGLHVSTNGRALAALLEDLVRGWPVPIEELAIIGHSMGGLVARSACHYADLDGGRWRALLRRLVFLGTPHHGAPLERGGNWIHAMLGAAPYTAPLARLGRIRSAGITDLRHGNLLDEDWEGRDRFARTRDVRRPVPLPEGVVCHAIAATTGEQRGDLKDRLLGDGLVPVESALGRHRDAGRTLAIDASRQWVAHGMHHMELLGRPEVYERMAGWLAN